MDLRQGARIAACFIGLAMAPVAAAEDWFVSLDLGQTEWKNYHTPLFYGGRIISNGIGIGVGRSLNRHLAVQVEWQDYASMEWLLFDCGPGGPCRFSLIRPETALALRFRGDWPMGETWHLGASLAYAQWEADFGPDDWSDRDMFWSVESSWQVGTRWRAGLEYLAWLNLEPVRRSPEVRATRLGLTLRYAF